MTDKTKVKFLKSWKYAYGGHTVVPYTLDQECELSDDALEAAIEDGVIELSGSRKKAKAAEKPAAEAANSSEQDKKKVEK